jgi:hypothetical protein
MPARLQEQMSSIVLRFAGIFLLGISSTAFPANVRFERFDFPATSVGKNTQIHPVNLVGGPELELALVSGDGNVTIFSQNASKYIPVQKFPLPLPPGEGQHLYYGFARIMAKDHYSLVILSPGSVTYYPLENGLLSATPKILFQTKLISQSSPGPIHRYFDMAIDLNGDELDELLLPGDNGFSISRQVAEGKYENIELPRKAFKSENSFTFSRDIPDDPVRPTFFMTSLTKRRGTNDLLFFDANSDGRLDLIYSSTATGPGSRQVERYDVFLQNSSLGFASKPSQSFAVPYDSQADATFRDLNQDGRLDAILVRSNLDIVNPRTVVKFFIGEEDGYQVFTRETDRFVTKDPVGLVQMNDFNSDGVTDFAMTFFSYQFGSMEDIVDLAFANKIQFRLQYFLGRGKEGFPRRPDTEVPITLNTKLENFRGNPPVMIVKDMNGDKMMDLAVRTAATELQIFLSHGNYAIGNTPAESFHIPEQASLSFLDINSDGLNDIMVSDPATNNLSLILPLQK